MIRTFADDRSYERYNPYLLQSKGSQARHGVTESVAI